METGDTAAVREFLARESPGSVLPASALVGKLVGDLVAVLAMEITQDSVAIRDLVVARDVRLKRIGRFMIDELHALAAKMDRDSVIVECTVPSGFLQRVGFADEGGRMVRRVVR